MTVYLVRHAKAGDPARWAAPDYLRPLSGAGRRQAKALIDVLADVSVGRVVSSPTARCCATVEPLARDRGLIVELDEKLTEDTDPGVAMVLLEELAAQEAVACTTGTLSRPSLSGWCSTAYGSPTSFAGRKALSGSLTRWVGCSSGVSTSRRHEPRVQSQGIGCAS